MALDITVLDQQETEDALTATGSYNETLLKVSEMLMTVVNTPNSIFVSGLSEKTINMLRTKMSRRDVRISVKKASVAGKDGHVLTGVSKT